MSGHIYLTGFMGAGKTAAGRVLARMLGRPFIDMDARLEKAFGRSIPDFFAQKGESAFRRAESRLLEKIQTLDPAVAATGGGVIQRPENRERMAGSGITVYVRASLDTCRTRVGKGAAHRPLWRDDAAVRALFEKREPLYAQADHTVETDGLSAEQVAQVIVRRLMADDRFSVDLGGTACPVTVTLNGPEELTGQIAGRRVFLLTDRKVAGLHLDRYQKAFQSASVPEPVVMALPGGERIKTLGVARRIYERLLAERFNRDDVLVALGGGTVTDLGAYVAATYKRGMDSILVSTTLLGCVDAAIGGKAAVNLGTAKNMVGMFSRPRAVILDALSLGTLPRPRISEGLIEAYKTGLVQDPSLAELIETHHRALMAKDRLLLFQLTARSARAKAVVVSEDFTEKGKRAILNFGHTYGHAVEGFHQYRVSHGRAVALGLAAATRLSLNRGLIPSDTADRILKTISRLAPNPPDLPPLADAWEIMLGDKKIRAGRLVFVLLEGPGRPLLVNDVTRVELDRAARELAGDR